MKNELTPHPGIPAKQAEKPQPQSGLRGKSYAALFRSNRIPERIEFDVDGKPCYVDLLLMDKDARDEFVARSGGSGLAATKNLPDLHAFLVGNTVVGYCFWKRPKLADGKLGEWQEVRPPEGAPNLYEAFRNDFDAVPEFWDDLLEECYRVNAFGEPDRGN